MVHYLPLPHHFISWTFWTAKEQEGMIKLLQYSILVYGRPLTFRRESGDIFLGRLSGRGFFFVIVLVVVLVLVFFLLSASSGSGRGGGRRRRCRRGGGRRCRRGSRGR